MVLEIENAPGQPKWVWLPSLVPIVSVGWNFGAKWRARDVTIGVTAFSSACILSDKILLRHSLRVSPYSQQLSRRHCPIVGFDLLPILLSHITLRRTFRARLPRNYLKSVIISSRLDTMFAILCDT